MRFEGARSHFPLIRRKISVCMELRGVVGGRVWPKSDLFILLLNGPEVGPQDCSTRGYFCSSHFSAIRVSAAMKWFALCIISGTVVEGFSTNDQNSLDGHISVRNAWITTKGYASCSAGPGRTGVVCSQEPLGRPEAVGAPTESRMGGRRCDRDLRNDYSSRSRGIVGWSTRHIGFAMSLVACCQGHCRLVGPSRWLCHAASRMLSGVLQAGQLVALALPCHQSPAIKGATGWPLDFQLTLPRFLYFGNSLGVRRELAESIGSLLRCRKGVCQKKIETCRKIVRGSQKACRELGRFSGGFVGHD
ncbi:hypothetical protein BHM03_00032926 [Ensete ventricosum]|nr:hypothetical protein BHM03_00032926 [Ensete ventricosum]